MDRRERFEFPIEEEAPAGALLRRFRLEHGLNQKELSEKCGVSIGYISALETGTRENPNPAILRRIGQALELSEEEAELLREAFLGRAGIYETAARERAEHFKADQIWIVARRPPPLSDEEYREAVVENLRRGAHYTFWTSQPEYFDEFLEALRKTAELEELETCLECIRTPKAADWINLTIYDPLKARDFRGRISQLGRGQTPTGAIPLDEWTLGKIMEDLKPVYETLQAMRRRGASQPEYQGFQWHFLKEAMEKGA